MTYTIAAIAVVLVWNIVVTLRGMADLNRRTIKLANILDEKLEEIEARIDALERHR